MRFEDRFTERAKNVFALAHEAAATMGHGYVGSEHILIGILRDNGGAAAKALRQNGIDAALVSDAIEKYPRRSASVTASSARSTCLWAYSERGTA